MEEVTNEIIDYTELIEEVNVNLNNVLEISRANYIADLFVIGIVSAVLVCCLFYKFFKLFY